MRLPRAGLSPAAQAGRALAQPTLAIYGTVIGRILNALNQKPALVHLEYAVSDKIGRICGLLVAPSPTAIAVFRLP